MHLLSGADDARQRAVARRDLVWRSVLQNGGKLDPSQLPTSEEEMADVHLSSAHQKLLSHYALNSKDFRNAGNRSLLYSAYDPGLNAERGDGVQEVKNGLNGASREKLHSEI